MRQTAFLLTVPLFAFGYLATAQKKQKAATFSFNGKIIGQQDGSVHLVYKNGNSEQINDSCSLKDGAFHFEGQITSRSMLFLSEKQDQETMKTLMPPTFF